MNTYAVQRLFAVAVTVQNVLSWDWRRHCVKASCGAGQQAVK